MPINRKKQKITQGFRENHKALDLRSVNFTNWGLQDCILTEDAVLIRRGIDGYGNDFAVFRPLQSGYDEIKYIHVNFLEDFDESEIGTTFEKGQILGKTQIRKKIGRGNSLAHHLHFVTVLNSEEVNPLDYFDIMQINWSL